MIVRTTKVVLFLCTITSLKELKSLLERLDKDNLNCDGSILLGYLWDINFDSEIVDKGWKDIYNMPIAREYLKEYITEAHGVRNYRDILWDEDKKNDLVLIYRKK